METDPYQTRPKPNLAVVLITAITLAAAAFSIPVNVTGKSFQAILMPIFSPAGQNQADQSPWHYFHKGLVLERANRIEEAAAAFKVFLDMSTKCKNPSIRVYRGHAKAIILKSWRGKS